MTRLRLADSAVTRTHDLRNRRDSGPPPPARICFPSWSRPLLLLLLTTGCRDKFEEPVTVGGVQISAEVLNKGHSVYRSLCARCHGTRGNGRTTAMRRDRPPRDLTDGLYKYTSVPDGGLPTDADLKRTITRGLNGNLMPGFVTLPDDQADALVHYVKTFSSRWQSDTQGKAISIPADPWKKKTQAAITEGRRVYLEVARCQTCHPGKVIDGAYGSIESPNLAKAELPGIFEAKDVYRAVAVGLPGTGMPAYGASLKPREIWALAHYTMSLKR